MSKRKKHRGVDNAWPDCPLVDGRALELLWQCAALWQDLASQLDDAEKAAAMGAGTSDIGVVETGYRSGVESRLGNNGALTDREARRHRDTRDRWLRSMGKLVLDMQVDLGYAEPEKGVRDQKGRLKILTS